MNNRDIRHSTYDDIIYFLFAAAGLLCSAGTVIAINIFGRSLAVVNFVYVMLIFVAFIHNRGRIFLSVNKLILLLFCFLLEISAVFSYLTNSGDGNVAHIILYTTKLTCITLGLVIWLKDIEMEKYIKVFFRYFYINAVIQMIWSWMERIVYTLFSFRLNDFVFGKIMGVQSSHMLTFIVNGQIRPSGLSWEPSNLAMVLIIGYLLAEKNIWKLLFAASILLSTSFTGIAMLSGILGIQLCRWFIKEKEHKISKNLLIIPIIVLILGVYMEYSTHIISHIVERSNAILGREGRDSSGVTHINYYIRGISQLLKDSIGKLFFGYGSFRGGYFFSNIVNMHSYLSRSYWNPESDFMTLFAGNGLVGLFVYYFFCFKVVKNMLKNKKMQYAYIVIAIVLGGICYLYLSSNWVLMIVGLLSLGTFSDKGKICNE